MSSYDLSEDFNTKCLALFQDSYYTGNIKYHSGIVNLPEGIEVVCNHQWQSYTGFSESYEFCTCCDMKKGL